MLIKANRVITGALYRLSVELEFRPSIVLALCLTGRCCCSRRIAG